MAPRRASPRAQLALIRLVGSFLAMLLVGVYVLPMVASAAGSYETRAEFVQSLDQVLGAAPIYPATPDFTDVPATSPYYGYIEAAYQAGWISGVGNGLFDPNGLLTRAQVAKIEILALGLGSAAQSLSNQPSSFTDAAQIPSWALGYVNEAVSIGILKGEPGGIFDPQGNLTTTQETFAVSQLLSYKESTHAPSATGLSVSAPSQATAGTPFSVTLSVQGDTTYTGTDPIVVSLQQPDGGAVLPSTAVFTNGAATIELSLTVAQSNTITVTDQAQNIEGSVSLIVAPSPAISGLEVSVPATATVGVPFSATLTLQDAYQNTVSFTGSVSVLVTLESDPNATAPSTASFQSGVATITVTPSVIGSNTLTVSAFPGSTVVTGTSSPIDVQASPTSITLSSSDLYAGGPLSASLPVASQNVSWSLVGPNGYTYPLFGSTTSTLTQTLPVDIAGNTYTLQAMDISSGVTYQTSVSVSSTYQRSYLSVTPSMIYNSQDMIPLFAQNDLGQGQTIALYEESGFNMSDIQQFDNLYGLPNPTITIRAPNGQPQPVDYSSGNGAEAAADIEWAHAMAPLSNIVVYEFSANSSFSNNVGAAAQDAQSQGFTDLSISFCAQGDLSTSGALESAGESGLGIFAATGDHGFEPSGSACWPAANPYVVAVGGLQYNSDGTLSYWNSGNDNSGTLWAGGYGISDYPAPVWQSILGYGSQRIIADVGLVANSMNVVFDGVNVMLQGTSLSTPEWAGIWALANQVYEQQNGSGVPGPAVQAIYSVAADTQGQPAFFQTAGTAAPFYGQVGFGAPDVAAFVNDLLSVR